ncbi:hypothetical protein PYW08_006775 [Mythimna loreyi]|uniref:Uncharacterized protein n=1 Tax=Mythimna loreyi TaxID=667449 RepID=A0ACC2RAJ7_9NEOP|nr:hypothetical protein PYW08_006775 [Mythimna loreyi]
MRLLALLAICFAAVAAVPSNPQRIVGGSVTTISQYPNMAALLYAFVPTLYLQSCAGIILNNRAVLTAAHCTVGDRNSQWRIRVGSTNSNSGGVVHNVNANIIHPEYNRNTKNADIAVLRTNSAFSFNNNVRAASIAGSNYNLGDNQVVWAAGWGATSNGGLPVSQLRHVELRTVNQATCRNIYAMRGRHINDNMLCSGWPNGGRDQCQGDSGGPLYHNGVVVGVCNFGVACGQTGIPSVNARVSRFTAWIQQNS